MVSCYTSGWGISLNKALFENGRSTIRCVYFGHEETHKENEQVQSTKDKEPGTMDECESCQVGFPNENALRAYRQLCHEIIHRCPCGKAFRKKKTLLCHQSSVSKDTPYKCTLCGMDFELKCVYLGHNQTHKENDKLQTATDKASETMHECGLCLGEFQSKKALQTQRRMCYRKMHKCPCDKEFSKKTTLLCHQISVSKDTPYKCTLCGMDFELKCVYLGHNKTHKENEKLQTTTDQGSETMHECGLCKVEFPSKRALNTHRLMCHRKMHKCPCGKEFSKKKTLLCHQISVSKVTSYKCILCGMDFELKCVYLGHEKSHTQNEGDQPPKENDTDIITLQPQFLCEECGKSFAVKYRLDQHMLNHSCSSFVGPNSVQKDNWRGTA